VLNTVETPSTPSPYKLWRNALFDAKLFWIKAVRMSAWDHVFDYDFGKNGKQVYRKHYQDIEDVLQSEADAGRPRRVLRWDVSDGWGPLVKFLDKAVPIDESGEEVEFPFGNAPDEFIQRRLGLTMERAEPARRRRWLLFAFLAAAPFALTAYGMLKPVGSE